MVSLGDVPGVARPRRFSDLTTDAAEDMGAFAGALVGAGAGGEEGAEMGAAAGALAGADGHLLTDEEIWYPDDAIPAGTAAALVLLEHRWAVPLRGAIERAGGSALADAWIHPADLVEIGLASRVAAETS
jgi:hypothetical protein